MNHDSRHYALTRQALLSAFQERHSLRFIEKYAQENLLNSFADDINETQANALQNAFETAYPKVMNGRLRIPVNDADLLRLFDNNANHIAQFSMLSYVTERGCDIHALRNPAGLFNDEFKESSDENGHLKADTRMGLLSAGAYAREKLRAKEASELWCGMTWRARSEVAALAICRYGIRDMPDFLNWKHDDPDTPMHQHDEHLISQDTDRQHAPLRKLTRFAHGILAPYDLVFRNRDGKIRDVSHALDSILLRIYATKLQDFVDDTTHFRAGMNSLYSSDGTTLFISRDNRHYMHVTDEYIVWLAEQNTWDNLANGVIEHGVAEALMSGDTNDPALYNEIDLLV